MVQNLNMSVIKGGVVMLQVKERRGEEEEQRKERDRRRRRLLVVKMTSFQVSAGRGPSGEHDWY